MTNRLAAMQEAELQRLQAENLQLAAASAAALAQLREMTAINVALLEALKPYVHPYQEAYTLTDLDRSAAALAAIEMAQPKLPADPFGYETPDNKWMRSGGLIYRLTDERRPANRDEIRVSMAGGSRSDEDCARRAGELLDMIERAGQPVVPSEATLIPQGWEVHHNVEWSALTDEANATCRWAVTRLTAPYCDREGTRSWSASTLAEAMTKAHQALGLPYGVRTM